jgi:hypothetical protein
MGRMNREPIRLPVPEEERRRRERAARALRRRMLGGLVCLAGAWLLLRLDPVARKVAQMRGWGAFPSGVFQAWHMRPPGSDATALVAGGRDRTGKRRGAKRGRRKVRKSTGKRPRLKAPAYMRDALRDAPAELTVLPREFEGLSKRKAKRRRMRVRKAGKSADKRTRSGAFGTAMRRPSKRRARLRPPKAAKAEKRASKRMSASKAKSASRGRARPATGERRVKVDFDGRSRRTRAGRKLAYRLPNSSIGKSPSFSPARSARAVKPKEKQPPKAKAVTLSKLIGTGALTPPKPETIRKAPSFNPLKGAFPPALPDGKAYERKTPAPGHVETISPPDEHDLYERWLEIDENKKRKKDQAHWHGDGKSILYMHFDKVWASPKDRRWSWLVKSGSKWWTVADGAQRMLRYKERWWWRTEFGWFPLAEGKAVAAGFAVDWKRKGLLAKGWSLKFSKDLARVAVATPGVGTTVFDARTGQYLDFIVYKKN